MTITNGELEEFDTAGLWELHQTLLRALERRLIEEVNKAEKRLRRITRIGAKRISKDRTTDIG